MITIKIRTTADLILNSIMLAPTSQYARGALLTGCGVLAKTYAKIYYRGGGWYAISGYAADGSDVHPIIDTIKDLKSVSKAVLKEGGYYFNKKGEIVGVYTHPNNSWQWIQQVMSHSPRYKLPGIAVR